MLTVTDYAKDCLAMLLKTAGEPDGTVVRMLMGEDGIELGPGTPEPTDLVYELRDRPIFVVDKTLAAALADRTLDAAPGEGAIELFLDDVSG